MLFRSQESFAFSQCLLQIRVERANHIVANPLVTRTLYVPVCAFGIDAYNAFCVSCESNPVTDEPLVCTEAITVLLAFKSVTVTKRDNGLNNPIVNFSPIVKFGVLLAFGNAYVVTFITAESVVNCESFRRTRVLTLYEMVRG